MSTRLSLYAPDAGVLLSFLRPAVSLRGLRTFCEVRLLLRGVAPHDFALLRFCLHAASLLQVGSHVQGICLRPIVTKKERKGLKQRHTETVYNCQQSQ